MMTESKSKTWLLMSFVKLSSPGHGDIQDWSELKSRLSLYLWVPGIHDQTSRLFWSEVMKIREGSHSLD